MKKFEKNELIPYSSYEKRELSLELEELPLSDKHTVFNTIIYNQEKTQLRELYWLDILKAIQYYYSKNLYTKQELKKYFYSKEAFSPLEQVGLDYNYTDRSGFNFLHFFVHESSSLEKKDLNFSDSIFDYVASQTKDIYHLSQQKENILFSMMNVSYAGIYGEKLDELLTKHSFDIQHKNIYGQNILDKALEANLVQLAEKLIKEYKIDYTHSNQKGKNILRHFLFFPANKNARDLFAFVAPQLNTDIIIEKDGLFDTWFDWAEKKANVHATHKEQCVKWFMFITQLMIDEKIEINFSHPNAKAIHGKINQHKKEFLSEYEHFYNLEKTFELFDTWFSKKELESVMSEKNVFQNKKIKI